MPATMEDPANPAIFRSSGDTPYPVPNGPPPIGIIPRQVVLRDRVTMATLIPFTSPTQVPLTLLAYLSDQFSREIEKGDTYPMTEPLPFEDFGPYWFGIFGAIMLQGKVSDISEVHHLAQQGHDWEKACLGSFYIKPNYPGRSSHVCNGGFLVTDGARNRGVGRLMGETYLEWAPKLGYTYSVFNLIYETNVASCRIWDALGFKRIGRVKGCGRLRSYPGELVDAIMYGRDLGQDEDFVSEERFDKIRFYLKNGKYPNGADRAEKSRLRSAATHYKLIQAQGDQPEMLMLKGKEVVSDPQRQYEVARQIHHRAHGGINKTTASIAESYHWVRIKETVSQVIRNCPECSEMNKNLVNNRNVLASDGNPQYMQPIQQTPVHPPAHQTAQDQREESPSAQLRIESAAKQQVEDQVQDHGFSTLPNFGTFDLPVDPALMESAHNYHITGRLEDLPPSPFLSAGRGLTMPQLSTLDMQMPDLPPQLGIHQQQNQDVNMDGTVAQDRINAREEIRRRLTRAGYNRE